jgi:hypothetical protein
MKELSPRAIYPVMHHTLYALRDLRRILVRFSPIAIALSKDPSIAERVETWPCDHDVAQILVAIRDLRRALFYFINGE